jgi:hypothetical protein
VLLCSAPGRIAKGLQLSRRHSQEGAKGIENAVFGTYRYHDSSSASSYDGMQIHVFRNEHREPEAHRLGYHMPEILSMRG